MRKCIFCGSKKELYSYHHKCELTDDEIKSGKLNKNREVTVCLNCMIKRTPNKNNHGGKTNVE